MADLFSDAWMKAFMGAWNSEPKLVDELAKINFSSTIGYGFADADQATGIIMVEKGRVISAGSYNGEALNWDIRAAEKNWNTWLDKGIGMAGLGMAYMSGKIKFKTGDYSAMIKDPRMATPFIESFNVMGRVSL